MKKRKNIIILIISLIAVIVSLSAWFLYKAKINDDSGESSVDENIPMENLTQQAIVSLESIKKQTDSEYITLFDKYNSITLKSQSLEEIEDGIYSGMIEVSSPDFEKGFNKYVAEHDDNVFQTENYAQIIDDILSQAEIKISEFEILFYLDDELNLSPILTDDIINALYGNLPDVYYDGVFNSKQEGVKDED